MVLRRHQALSRKAVFSSKSASSEAYSLLHVGAGRLGLHASGSTSAYTNRKLVHLQKCLTMPSGLPNPVLDRFVRLCLFDGQGPVSNVHTVRATVTAKDDRTWTFSTRVTDTSSGLDYGELYLRYNFGQNNVQLLIEATVVCKIETSEPIELSIGHVTVPLFDENGGPLPAKGFDLQFEGGSPFDRQQEVDSRLGQFGAQTKAQPKPHIQLKLTAPNKETKEFMDLCPTTILGNLAHLQLHSLYRHVLASELSLNNQAIEHGANAIYAPHLVQFPSMADQPDVMDVLRRRWNEFAKRERAFRKPAATEVMKQEFIRIVKSTYFINQLKDFQPYVFGNKNQEQFRANAIQDFLRRIASDQSSVSYSLSSDLIFEPFSMEEVALPMIGRFSVPVLPVSLE
ncbi:hypothetical protein BOX15_Mlig013883g4 [Macrostomum lignano]|uniref:Uncharacterized protein n=1 Tax=Macrostomum lignano TaxID=282301 RepID=A0A267H567_9PLAT|nr:hypothetical protein BOX15_Mlig013883g4 [Macrostomum lignano]